MAAKLGPTSLSLRPLAGAYYARNIEFSFVVVVVAVEPHSGQVQLQLQQISQSPVSLLTTRMVGLDDFVVL